MTLASKRIEQLTHHFHFIITISIGPFLFNYCNDEILTNPADDLDQSELVVLTICMVTIIIVTNISTTSYTHTTKMEEIYTLIVGPPLGFGWAYWISIGLKIGHWPTKKEGGNH